MRPIESLIASRRRLAAVAVLAMALAFVGGTTALAAPSPREHTVNVQWRNEGFSAKKGWTTVEIGPYAEGDLVPFRLTVTNPSKTKTAVVGAFALQVTSFAHGVTFFDYTTEWGGAIAPATQDKAVRGWLRTTFPAGLKLAPGQSATITFKAHLAKSTPGRPAAGMRTRNGVRAFSVVDAPGVGFFGRWVSVKFARTPRILPKSAVAIVKTSDAPTTGLSKGAGVTYSYVIANVGDEPLLDIVVADDKLGEVATTPGPLAPGASLTFTRTAVLIETTTSTATVTAQDQYGRTVSDSAQLTVPVLANARLFGFSFDDLNRDGAWEQGESGEPALAGSTIILGDALGNPLEITSTDGMGAWGFDVTPGVTYVVSFAPFADRYLSVPMEGNYLVTPVSGQDSGPWHFGSCLMGM